MYSFISHRLLHNLYKSRPVLSVTYDSIDTNDWRLGAINSIQAKFVESLFQGKEGSNNRKIIQILLKGKAQSFFEIREKIDKKYSTVHYRIRALEELGVIETKASRLSEKNLRMSLWSLTPLGLWVAAHRDDMIEARNKCSEHITKYWMEFTRIYDLDKIEGQESSYRKFTEWLKSDEGLMCLLETFGSLPLTGRTNALITFRTMMEIALVSRRMTSLTFAPDLLLLEHADTKYHTGDAYRELGELATRHEKFRKLDSAMHDVNAALLDHMEKEARQELIQKLKPVLGDEVATKLSSIPILNGTSKYPASLATGLLHPGSFTVSGIRLAIEPERVIIQTLYPDRISAEWKHHCDVKNYRPEYMKLLENPEVTKILERAIS